MYAAKYEACGILAACQIRTKKYGTTPGLTYFQVMSLSFRFTLSLLTFLLLPGFLLGQVSQKVQW